MILEIRVRDILKERGITNKEFSEMSGIREGYLSEIFNNRRSTLNREHVGTVIETLRDKLEITDMNEIFIVK